MDTLTLQNLEVQFGLLVRDKSNQNNHVLIRLENMEQIIGYYNVFKKQYSIKIPKSKENLL